MAVDLRQAAAARRAAWMMELLDTLIKRVIPRALHLYLAAPQVR